MPKDVIPTTSVSAERLKSFITRIERLSGDRDDVSEDIRSIYSEVKGAGYDVAVVRKVIALRKKAADKRREEEELMQTYLSALGMTE